MIADIERMKFPGARFDTLVCSHVLEHVDDTRALAEMFRVLVPGGRAFLAVPLVEGWETTYENSNVLTERERLLHFGQRDHVRYYGRDFRERVQSAGFSLSEFTADGATCVEYALVPGERAFVAEKPVLEPHSTTMESHEKEYAWSS